MKDKIQAILDGYKNGRYGSVNTLDGKTVQTNGLEEATNAILELVVEELEGVLSEYKEADSKLWAMGATINHDYYSNLIQDRISKLRQ